MTLPENLFDLTTEQADTSKMMYNGKVVKCLVAPYHSYAQLEKVVKYTKTTYLFPEREMSTAQITTFISMIAASPSTQDEIRIITANQNVILDMIDSSVRVLTEDGRIVASPCKTFAANIHTIRRDLLENEDHRVSKATATLARERIQKLIDRVQPGCKPMTRIEFDAFIAEIRKIGEPVISGILEDQARDRITII